MRNAASWAFTLGTGLLVTVAGLALKLNILIVLTGALFLAGLVFYLVDYRRRPDRRVFLTIAAPQLTQIYQGRTEVQGDKACSIYIGKWMRVTGTVRDIHDFIHRTMWLEEKGAPSLTFRRKKKMLDVIHKGDKVEVIGKVASISPHSVRLDYCELITTETPVSPAAQT